MLQPLPILHLRKDRRPALSHLGRITLHNSQIRAYNLRQINLIHNQQVRARDARPALARDLVPSGDINHVDDEIRQFARVVGGEVIAAGLNQQEVGLELLVQGFESQEVGTDVLADGGVRASAGFDGADARWC